MHDVLQVPVQTTNATSPVDTARMRLGLYNPTIRLVYFVGLGCKLLNQRHTLQKQRGQNLPCVSYETVFGVCNTYSPTYCLCIIVHLS